MERARSISKSMLSYLKRARDHKEFLLKETQEFEKGKRHLAHMMGIDPIEMTQEDIDSAIKYLLPSGLFDKKARPQMQPPEVLYKAQKDAQFDSDGRPFHYLFYTIMANFHENLSLIADKNRELNKYEDEQLAKGVVIPPEGSKYILAGREWIKQEQMSDKFIEKLRTIEYEMFIKSLEKLMDHPYSSRAAEIFEEYSHELPGQTLQLSLPELKKDEKTGQIYTEQVVKCREQWVETKVFFNGSGIFDFEGHDILYFPTRYVRYGILCPLKMSGMQDKVDIYSRLVEPFPQDIGTSGIAIAIRYAVSTSIAAYVEPELRERMRLAGLLTMDTRVRERKKFGQEGARRKYTWKKR